MILSITRFILLLARVMTKYTRISELEWNWNESLRIPSLLFYTWFYLVVNDCNSKCFPQRASFYQNISFLFNLSRVTLWICFSLFPSPCPPVIVYSILNRPHRIHSVRRSTPHRRDATQWESDSCSKPTWSHVSTSIDGFCKVFASHSTTTTSPGNWLMKGEDCVRKMKKINHDLSQCWTHFFFWFWYVFFFLTNWMKCETNESYKKMLFMSNFSALTFLLSFSILYKKPSFLIFPSWAREKEPSRARLSKGKIIWKVLFSL